MATYTSNYAWTKPAGSDPVDISVLNDNLDSQDGIMHDAFLNMADPFSESSTYAVGAIVLYGTKTYKCHTAVTTAGSWTGSTNWTAYKLAEGGLTAGNYVNIQNGVINVQTEIGTYNYVRYEMESTGGGDIKLIVRKYINNVLDSTTEYPNDGQHHEIDDVMDIWYEYGPYLWHYKLLVASTDHAAGYEESWSYQDTSVHTVNFQFAQDDSTTLVTKGDLDDADGDIYAVMGQMGAKNLVNVTAESTTIQHVTFTVNADGTISTTGTSTADFSTFVIGTLKLVPGKKYVITGSDAPGSSTFYIRVRGVTDSSENYYQITDATEFIAGQSDYTVNLRIYNNINMDGITFYPMVRLASDTDDTYQPYAKTNKQLTDEIATKVDKVTGKGLSTNDYDNTEKAEVAKVANKADKTATASGETLALVPTSEGRALLHTAYGMSTQDGTPTPSSPVDIVSAKADFRSVGKNLIPITSPYKLGTGIDWTLNADGSVTANGSSIDVNSYVFNDHYLLKRGTYILSGGHANNKSITTYVDVSPYPLIAESKGEPVLFTVNEDYYPVRVRVRIERNVTCSDEVFYPMLRLADVTDSTYEPYTKHDTTTDLTLRAIEVTSSDDYNLVRDGKYYVADTLDYTEDDGFVVTRRVGEKIFDGSEDEDWRKDNEQYGNGKFIGVPEANQWTTVNVAYTAFMYNLSDIKLSRNAYYATPFVTPALAMFKLNSLNMQGFAIRTADTVEMDIIQFKTWLSTNNIQLTYVLATPTTETIATAQALALLGLKTYDESTTISSQAEPSCTVAIEYAKERLGALALTAYNTAKGNDLRITALEG